MSHSARMVIRLLVLAIVVIVAVGYIVTEGLRGRRGDD